MDCSLTRPRRFLLACGIVLSLACSMSAQQIETDEDDIKIETNIVVLNLTVTTPNGELARGLKRADFAVTEDGTPQSIVGFSREDTPFAAIVLIDFSGSMESRLSLARAAAIKFLDGLRGEDAAAVYRFDSEIVLLQDFSASRDLAPTAYTRRAEGMTVLYDAIALAAEKLATRPEKRRAMVVISDGADTRSRISGERAINAALAAGATIYAVDMSDTTAGNQRSAAGVLRNFAQKTGGRFIATPGGREMRETIAEIIKELSTQYTLTYRPSNTAKDGKWRTIHVETSRPGWHVRTRKGYRVGK